MDPSVDRAETFLRTCGFTCEREPPWILEGQKPDFFCSGRTPLWVEVKTLSATPSERKRAYLQWEFEQRSFSVLAPGNAFAEVSERATSKDIKVAMKLTQVVLAEYERAAQPWRHAFVIIPHHPVYDQIARLVVEEEEGPVLILSCVPRSGQYEITGALEPRSYDEPISVTIDSRHMEPKSLEDLVGTGHPLIALELVPGADRFQISGVALIDENPWLHNSKRLSVMSPNA